MTFMWIWHDVSKVKRQLVSCLLYQNRCQVWIMFNKNLLCLLTVRAKDNYLETCDKSINRVERIEYKDQQFIYYEAVILS